MSMVMTLYGLAEVSWVRVLAEPRLIVDGLMSCQPGSRDAALLPRRECDIDKSWYAIHFTLTGSIEPTGDALGFLFGGEEVGDDLGLGPARAHQPPEVKTTAIALEAIPADEFRRRFDHRTLRGENIYAIGENEAYELEWVAAHYQALRDFIIDAARLDEGLIITLT